MTLRGFLFWLAMFAVLIVGCLVVVSKAEAHGTQHGFVSPAGPCHVGTAGNVEVVHDFTKNRYLKYRCSCSFTEMGYLVCYWKLISIQQALKNIYVPSNTKAYYQARIVSMRVHWLAWHTSINGCAEHFGWRKVIYVRHR